MTGKLMMKLRGFENGEVELYHHYDKVTGEYSIYIDSLTLRNARRAAQQEETIQRLEQAVAELERLLGRCREERDIAVNELRQVSRELEARGYPGVYDTSPSQIIRDNVAGWRDLRQTRDQAEELIREVDGVHAYTRRLEDTMARCRAILFGKGYATEGRDLRDVVSDVLPHPDAQWEAPMEDGYDIESVHFFTGPIEYERGYDEDEWTKEPGD